jgi:origin recognition complex subunit 3
MSDLAARLDKIPSAFIVTGPNIASQGLLFRQLADTLQTTCHGRFVNLRSAEAPTLKTALKKIIKDATARSSNEDDEFEESVGQDVRPHIAMPTYIRMLTTHI